MDFADVEAVDDGEKFIYVNGGSDVSADAEDEDVAELMEFFKNSNGMNEKFMNLSERVDELKNEEREVLAMCKLVEEYAAEYTAEHVGAKAVEIALKLLAENVFSVDKIASITGLSVEEINDLAKKM